MSDASKNALRRYEVLLLTVPEITQDEVKLIESEVGRAIKEVKGEILSFERWGKYRLSYPINNNEYGVYILVRFEVPQAGTIVQDINKLCVLKLNHVVVRSMVTALDPHQSLEYQRPKSLEETPSRDVGAFIKDQKVERLISSIDAQRDRSMDSDIDEMAA